MKQIKFIKNNRFTFLDIIGLFLLGILITNILGYLVLVLAWDQRFKSLEAGQESLQAGQEQLAGFLMVPSEKMTGPISTLYLSKRKGQVLKIKEPDKRLIPKNKGGKDE